MNNKDVIKKIILILVLILVFLLILLLLYRLKNMENNRLNVTNTDDINTDIIEDENDYIFYYEDETGSAEYNEEQLNNFQVEIIIPDDVIRRVSNNEELYLKIKEYTFLNGLIDATKIEYQGLEEIKERNSLVIFLKLNNPDENVITILLNNNDNSIEFIDDYWDENSEL